MSFVDNKVGVNLLKKPKAPFVYIVGAGPGDPGLLTLKAHYLITEIADIVVYDRLITDEIMNLVPDDVELIYAGKSCRKHHMTQEEINICIVEEAKKGKVVVRLKGGDPFIFGRGGEEVEHLVAEGIDFDIVPGVNAADGCAAYQSIPLTHRSVANSVRFVTGHKQKGQGVDFDWPGLAREDTTLVIYMGMTNIEIIAEGLLGGGLVSSTPAVIISAGTTKDEQSVFTTLGDLCEAAKRAQLPAPTLIIIGKVVALAKNWLA